jgi:hypothetical protein
MDSLALPLPASALPDKIRRFGDPAAPGPARTMAARGLVPVTGTDLVTLLVQLSADAEATIAEAAKKTLAGVPDGVVLSAAESSELHPAILAGLLDAFPGREDIEERLAANSAVDDTTVLAMARGCSEMVSEIIATNQQRLLGAPKIIEALYKNSNTRMSTADRLVELAARNGVELTGIAAFKEHVEAIRGQLIPEPSAEPLPMDVAFKNVLAEDADDPNAVEVDPTDDKEKVKKRYGSLRDQIADLDLAGRIRLASVGSAAARAILVRNPNKQVAFAAISSPKMNEAEATAIAHSKEIGDEILRYIGNRREWLRNYEIKRALVFNPKTPVGISLRFLGHMRDHELKALTRSRGIPGPLKTAAIQRMEQKEKKGRGKR